MMQIRWHMTSTFCSKLSFLKSLFLTDDFWKTLKFILLICSLRPFLQKWRSGPYFANFYKYPRTELQLYSKTTRTRITLHYFIYLSGHNGRKFVSDSEQNGAKWRHLNIRAKITNKSNNRTKLRKISIKTHKITRYAVRFTQKRTYLTQITQIYVFFVP